MKPLPVAPIFLLLSLAAVWGSASWAAEKIAASDTPAHAKHPVSQARSPAPAKEALPQPPLFTAKYKVFAAGFEVGEMRRSLKALGNNTYLVETKARTTGLVSVFKPDEYLERSVVQSTTKGYRPLEFSSRYTGRSKDVVERMRFDWKRMRAQSLRDGKNKELAIEPGVLDKLSYQVVLRRELSQGATRFHYRVADRGKIEDYDMEVVGRETLDTAKGKQPTIKVKKGTTTIWFAPALDYLPVKLEQKEDGHTVATHLQSLTRKSPVAVSAAAPRG